ncbi:MAG: hypothetical protein QXZ09_06945 [Candidatus Methanomethylicaceae archaeon]
MSVVLYGISLILKGKSARIFKLRKKSTVKVKVKEKTKNKTLMAGGFDGCL